MMPASALVLVTILCVALILGAWAGLFGVHARTTTRRLLRGSGARRQEQAMVEVMRIKIQAAAARSGRDRHDVP